MIKQNRGQGCEVSSFYIAFYTSGGRWIPKNGCRELSISFVMIDRFNSIFYRKVLDKKAPGHES